MESKDQTESTPLVHTALECNYEPPSWGSVPTNSLFSVETIKAGQTLSTTKLANKSFFLFGRQPNADFVLEHPSISRQHCVLQLDGQANKAFLYDLNSTHGTFLNKKKIPSFEFIPVNNGDLFKVGFSSRFYVFSSSESTVMEVTDVKKQKTEKKKRVHEVTWGFQEDAVVQPEVEEIEWREYAEHNKLTTKQQKLSEKIKKLEKKKERIELECKKIHEKEAKFDQLTGAQITTLLNNEMTLEQTNLEIEELEESLETSIHEKLFPDQSRWRMQRKKKEESESDNDEFFDRTKKHKKCEESHKEAVSTEDLMTERTDLKERLRRLGVELESMESGVEEVVKVEDSLDVFMTKLSEERIQMDCQSHKKEIQRVETRLGEIARLLKVTDPEKMLSSKALQGGRD